MVKGRLTAHGLACVKSFKKCFGLTACNGFLFEQVPNVRVFGFFGHQPLQKSKRIAELAATTPHVWERVAWACYRAERYEEAIAEIGRAITIDPNDARSNWNMARVLTAGGRPKEAIEYAKMALRIDPGCVY